MTFPQRTTAEASRNVYKVNFGAPHGAKGQPYVYKMKKLESPLSLIFHDLLVLTTLKSKYYLNTGIR